MKQFTIFYSWQSDLNNKENKNFIEECIKKAIKEKIQFVEVDRDTKNEAGAVNIEEIIFEKIKYCDFFVADVSIIGKVCKRFKKRYTTNPNVMMELGYAVALLGWERILLVYNEKYGKSNKLPFDLRQHRLLTYNSKTSNLPKTKEILSNEIKIIIEQAMKDGPVSKKGSSNIILNGYDFETHKPASNLISYNIFKYPNYLDLLDKLIKETIKLFKDIGNLKIGTEKEVNSSKEDANRIGNLFFGNLHYVKCVPYNVEILVKKLNTLFKLDCKEEYFSFGDLKISTSVVMPGPLSSGPSLDGSDDEKKKYTLYNELREKVDEYEDLLKIADCLKSCKIFPIVISNNSQVLDENIDISLKIDSNKPVLNKERFACFLKRDKLLSFVKKGYLTDLFYNYIYTNDITNDIAPTNYPIMDALGMKEIDITDKIFNEIYDSLIFNFYDSIKGLEATLHFDELRSGESKWASKVILLESNDKLEIAYKVRSSKSNGNIGKVISE